MGAVRFATCRFVAQLLWVLVGVATIVAKVTADDIVNYPEHLTYWAFTAETLFFALTLGSVVDSCVDCASTVFVVCFFPLYGVAWFIYVAVTILFIDDPEFALDLLNFLSPGLFIVGNDFVHFWPVFVLTAYALLNAPFGAYALNRCFARGAFDRQPLGFVAAIAYLIAGGGLVFIAAYVATLAGVFHRSPQEVYDTTIGFALGLALYLFVATLVNGVPLVVCACACGVCRRWDDTRQRRRRINWTEFEDADIAESRAGAFEQGRFITAVAEKLSPLAKSASAFAR